jgi:hypothetical protein
MGTTYHNKPLVTDGLVFYVDAANKVSYPGRGTTLFDMNSADNGTLSSSPTFVNVNGGVIDFDSTDYVSTPLTETFWNNLSGCTINQWVLADTLTGTSTAYSFCAGTYEIGTGTKMFGITQYNNRWYIFGGQGTFDDTGISVSASTWYNVTTTSTYSSNSIDFYLNGIHRNNSTLNSNNMKSSSVTLIGKYSGQGLGTTAGYWRGYIAGTQIYNRALSASEVAQNYNALKNRFI